MTRQAAYRLGLSAEGRAALWLRLKGYRILARRYRTPLGELDLVARRGRTLAFVEVKARASLRAAGEAMTGRGKRRVSAAARAWLTRHPVPADAVLRFDVVLVAPGRLPRHLVNAWTVDEPGSP